MYIKDYCVLRIIIFWLFANLCLFLNCIQNESPTVQYNRIISLAPSITETLFALGLGDKIVGVTNFCDYPEEAGKIAKIGGYYDPNYEAIMALKPDLIVMLEEQETTKEYFNRIGLKSISVSHKTVKENLHSIDTLGKFFKKEEFAQKLLLTMNRTIDTVREQIMNSPHPTVLMTIGRSLEEVKNLYVVGNDEYYDEMITIAGGINAFKGGSVRYPMISFEGIIQINPDVIIEIVAEMGGNTGSPEDYRKTWSKFNDIKAIRLNRIYYITEPYAVRPGPRFVLLIQDLAKILHPEIPWGDVWRSLK